MADTAFLDEVGLSMTTLFPSQGATALQNMARIIGALRPDSSAIPETRVGLVDGFKLWCTCSPPDTRMKGLMDNSRTLYELIGELAVCAVPEETKADDDYKGFGYLARELAAALQTGSQMDTTQALMKVTAPLAFAALERILLAPDIVIANKQIMQPHETAITVRAELCSALVRTMPYTGSIDIPNSFKCVTLILTRAGNLDTLKTDAKTCIQSLAMVCKSALVNAGPELIALAKLGGGNDQLLMQFCGNAEIYTNNPDAVHENIDLFMRQMYTMFGALYCSIAARAPAVLLPHVQYFIDQLTAQPVVGTMTLMVLDNLAKYDPAALYSRMDVILQLSSSIANSAGVVSSIVSAVAAADATAADLCLGHLVSLLERGEALTQPQVLISITNMMKYTSSVAVVGVYVPRIAKFKSANEVAFVSIDDYAAGRSLEDLTLRVDVLDAKINALNSKVAETCHNMADVIAYVDANMADMKDFLAEVVKKLPKPKRLEVVGTLRKTLYLHFECIHSGYEFGITSTDWSKWLKMGFSLVKAGQAIIDIGMGNPLGILKKGVECVQEIYSAYKTEDDDEFNSYITNPFLTSTEQDQLLNKLRDQGFFDIFDYDTQRAGWYLKNPEKDGKPPGGEAGSVTKVWKREGDPMINLEALTATATDFIQNDQLTAAIGYTTTAVGVVSAVKDAVSGKGKEKEEEDDDDESKDGSVSPLHQSKSPVSAATDHSSKHKHQHVTGGRAAAMKESFGASVTASAEEKLALANKMAAQEKQLNELNARMQALETKYDGLNRQLQEVRQQKNGCACIIA